MDRDASYLIQIQTDEDEGFQVFAQNKFQMMAVLKKNLCGPNLIVAVEAMENIMTATDYLGLPENNDLNFGNQQ